MARTVVALDPGLLAVLVIAGVFFVWYAVGAASNRRLARQLANEMRDCLLTWGGTSRVQAFGTTAFRMTTEEANPPFRDVSLVVTLEPREMPINWALAKAQGRRDVAVVDASLRQMPRVGFELVDPLSRVGRRRARAKSGWSSVNLGGKEYLLSAKNEAAVDELFRTSGDGLLGRVSALQVTAGSDAGITASVTLARGQVASVLTGLRALAAALTG